jgi:hypothetical protein
MTDWWRSIIAAVDDLDVVYCLTGESNIWLWGEAENLLPDKTTHRLPRKSAERAGWPPALPGAGLAD